MPRYFFHVHDGREILDTEGSELASLEDVRREAVMTASEALRGAGGGEFWSGADWRLVVLDEAGLEVLTLKFSAFQPGMQPVRRP